MATPVNPLKVPRGTQVDRGPAMAQGDGDPGNAEYPPDHQPGMQVPKGGSMCANCKYLGADSASCTSEYFIKWNGSDRLPAPADEYCSDWYEPKGQQPEQGSSINAPMGEPS